MILPNIVLATRFGEDPRVASLFFRSKALWLLGYPEAALADIDQALKVCARDWRRDRPVMGTHCLILYRRQLLRKLHDSKCPSR